ncbi:MAG: HEAT repeat domain-containing protein [Vicinamibacteria bacterium]|nr:HEAT repeat domain-containing protein [Vicinamibacteria bacterium]
MSRRIRSLPSILQNAFLSVVSALVFLVLAESAGLLLERDEPAPHESGFAANWDETGGEFFTAIGWSGGVHFNHEGLRDREHALHKLPGTRRVMCLGDSTTYGQHLRPEEAYPQVLERLIEERGGGVEVFNVALSGWSARQQLIAYRRICRKYAPDQVILGICLNDIGDMQNNLSRPPAILTALHRRSALVRRVVGAYDREIRGVRDLFEAPLPSKVRRGYTLLFEEIRLLRDEARADGAGLAVLVFPFRFQLEPDAPPPIPQKAIEDFCAREGIVFLDLLPAFLQLGPDSFECDHHFGASGARLVAREILDKELVMPPDRPAVRIPPGGVSGLLRALEDFDPRVRIAAVSALGQAGTQEAFGGLIRALADENENVCLSAERQLEGVRLGPSLLPELIQTFHGNAGLCHAVAARAIGLIGADAHSATPALVSGLGDQRSDVRRWTAWALGQIGPGAQAAVPELVRCMPDREMGWTALEALGRIGPGAKLAVPSILSELRDDRAAVRRLSAQALGRIGPVARQAAPGLMRALRDDRPEVRIAAIRALVRVEADPRKVTPALDRMLEDTQDHGMRLELEAALRKLRRRVRERGS